MIENGNQIVQIDTHDLEDQKVVWERAMVLYVVGENVTIDFICRFIRKH